MLPISGQGLGPGGRFAGVLSRFFKMKMVRKMAAMLRIILKLSHDDGSVKIVSNISWQRWFFNLITLKVCQKSVAVTARIC